MFTPKTLVEFGGLGLIPKIQALETKRKKPQPLMQMKKKCTLLPACSQSRKKM